MFGAFTKHCCGYLCNTHQNDLEGQQYIFFSTQDSDNNFKKLSIIQELQRIRMWKLLTSMIK